MKIVVIGGSGLIGAKTVERLRRKGHEVVAASPKSGVNTITGEGLADALAGAHVVVDVANSPSFEDKAVLEFFETSGRNLLTAEAAAGSGITSRCRSSALSAFRTAATSAPRWAQENLIKGGGIPYTIVCATQFFEFMGAIAQSGTVNQTVHLPPAYMQPIASDDVADVMADVALAAPVNGTIEIAGPERVRLSDLVGQFLNATNDPREVVADTHALYFGIELNDQSLTPGDNPRIGATRFDDWLSQSLATGAHAWSGDLFAPRRWRPFQSPEHWPTTLQARR